MVTPETMVMTIMMMVMIMMIKVMMMMMTLQVQAGRSWKLFHMRSGNHRCRG